MADTLEDVGIFVAATAPFLFDPHADIGTPVFHVCIDFFAHARAPTGMHPGHWPRVKAAFHSAAAALSDIRPARRAYVEGAVEKLGALKVAARETGATVRAPLADTGILSKDPTKAYNFHICCAFSLAILMVGRMLSVTVGRAAILEIGLLPVVKLTDGNGRDTVGSNLYSSFKHFHGKYWTASNAKAKGMTGETLYSTVFWPPRMKKVKYMLSMVAKPAGNDHTAVVQWTILSFYFGPAAKDFGSLIALDGVASKIRAEFPHEPSLAAMSVPRLDRKIKDIRKKSAHQRLLKFEDKTDENGKTSRYAKMTGIKPRNVGGRPKGSSNKKQ